MQRTAECSVRFRLELHDIERSFATLMILWLCMWFMFYEEMLQKGWENPKVSKAAT